MTERSSVRVRYAPSPTGFPHIGNIRTALFNWLYARHSGGAFVLRIEDTDRSRIVEGAYEAILESLQWLGLDWDEGPDRDGPYGPYRQSDRLSLYREIAERLIHSGHAYRCYCTSERLEALREEQRARKEPTGYDRCCRCLTAAEHERHEDAGTPYVVRFAIPTEGRTTFFDLFRGEISFENALIDDHVILKSDGWPTYQLASVVDDHYMEISHVLRGEEWISSTPRHVLEYQALGWELPLIGHFPLILGKDRSKLSKRHGAADVLSYRKMGYLPEALVNFLALLGWAKDDKTELLTCSELVRSFDLDGVSKNPAIFDSDKLEWMNGYYIRQLPVEELARRVAPFLHEVGILRTAEPTGEAWDYLVRIVPIIQERIKRLPEAVDYTDFFFAEDLSYDPSLLVPKGWSLAQSADALSTAFERLRDLPSFDEATLEGTLRDLAAELSVKTGQLFGSLRVAVTGRTVAPPLFQTMAILGRERTLKRITVAVDRLRATVGA